MRRWDAGCCWRLENGELLLLMLMLMMMMLSCQGVSTTNVEVYRRTAPNAAGMREYCEWEEFKPNCSRGQVVVMLSAQYGRMRIGRCVEDALGFLGCSSNVLSLADRKCSGRQSCRISIPDKDFDSTRPCNKEVKVYLEASYVCKRVADAERGCAVPIINGRPTYIPSTSPGSQCGSPAQPWVVDAEPGQHLDVSVIDFEALQGSDGKPPGCPGYILDSDEDGLGRRNVSLCPDGRQRERDIYRSVGHVIELVTSADLTTSPPAAAFLVRFDAVGCADLRAPHDAWLRRDRDDLVVGCHSSSQTWHLRCVGRRWSGVIGNCSIHLKTARKQALIGGLHDEHLPHVVTIGVVAVIATAMSTLIVCVGVFCFRGYARRERIKQQYSAIAAEKLYSDVPPPTSIADEDYGPMTSVSAAYMKTAGRSPLRRPPPATDYTHVWQLPLPQPHQDNACVTPAYGVGSINSRYYVLDHNHGGGIAPTIDDDIQ